MRIGSPLKAVAFAFILIAALADRSDGLVIEGVPFNNSIDVGNMTLTIRGGGLLRYMIFFKAYAGALYLPKDVDSEEALADVPKRLEVEYFQSIEGEDFGPATSKMIAKNVSAATFERIRDRIAYHNSLYEDVKPGDRYSLTYVPGLGTELALNGEPKGVVEGDDFAAALFSIWLGPKPIDHNFKKQLLGLK